LSFLRAENLSIERGGRLVASGVDLAVPSGTFLVAAGPNGAGKSSLLRVLSGEMRAHGGRVLLGGSDISKISRSALARQRAFLAQQNECCLPFLAREVVRFGAEAAGLSGRSAHRRSRDAMEMAGVTALAERPVSMLSGGEQQRVHWARVLAQLDGRAAGRAVFLDEPVSSLDLEHQHALLRQARELAKSGAAVVAVLHDLNLAAQYADQVLLLHGGRIHRTGPPARVLDPETVWQVFRVQARQVPHPQGGPPILTFQPAPHDPVRGCSKGGGSA